MSADSPRRTARGVPATVPPQVVCDRSIIDSVAGFINDVTLAHQPQCDPKDTITWARFETAADISDPRFGDDWELEGNVAPPLLLILGYGQGVQVWAIPANGEAVEVLSWRHGIVSALRVLPTPSYAENGRADEPVDAYADKRPLMAICDGTTPAGSNPQFCAVNFVSLKTGAQVKTIKFKNPVLDILANRSSIVITFHERIAVFDARSLEDRLSVTTCFPSPGINPNPVALGSRWMAYSENKLLHSKRSGGGCDGDGVSSYTATVLNAAKSFGKGLRELGEQVAAGLTGTTGSGMSSKSSSFDSATGDVRQPGVVTILDIKHPMKDVSPTSGTPVSINGSDPIVAHFIAHSESVVAMEFDNSGMMLLTADRRGHDFHMFRIQPHPVGSSLAAVHHLYVLHRGDTSAKVQNITFSLDSRWVAVSTLRGTTHVFPVTPYGGTAGVRTHTSLHVVNKLSRFHRSAGLTADGRSSSPISHSDSTNFCQMLMPYHNPTLPPFPRPTVVLPLAQLRQPSALGSPPGSAAPSSYSKATNTRQRLSSLSDDNGKPLSVCAVFAKSRSWLLDPPNAAREAPHKIQRKAVDSLFVMAGHGALIQYDLDTKLATNVAKEKICDDTPIELEVEAKAQWNLGRKDGSLEIQPPLTSDNWLVKDRNSCMLIDSTRQFDEGDDRCDSWLSQVEIITHAGPHRRLWMGPQFVFKTYNTPSGSNLSHIDVEAVEIGVSPGPSTTCRPERSSPLNMPLSATGRSTVPVLIESGSYSSIEQSPKLMDRFRHEHMNSDFSVTHGDSRLKEDLADAMRESPSVSHKDTGGHPQRRRPSAAGSSRATASSSPSSSPKSRSGGSGGVSSTSSSSSSAATLVGGDGTAATGYNSQYESLESLVQQQQHMKTVSIEKVVNPLGTVTTITGSCDSGLDTDDVLRGVSDQDYVIHENCDESLFRPVVAIFCDERSPLDVEPEDEEYTKPPEAIGNKLIVPVIEKSVDLELTKKESMKNRGRRQMQQQQQHIQLVKEVKEESDDEVVKFNLAEVSRKQKGAKKKQARDEADKAPVLIEPAKASRTEEREEKLSTKKSSRKDSKSMVEEEMTPIKMQQTKQSVEENTRKKQTDNEFKAKPTKGGKFAYTEALSDDEPVSKTPSDKIIKPLESEPTSKSKKTRKIADKEASAMETSLNANSKQSKDSERKTTKNRKSVERDALSDDDSATTKVSDKQSKTMESEPKSKSSMNRKSVEKESLFDDEFAAKTSSDKSGKLPKLLDKDSNAKSGKTRKSAEREVLSAEVSVMEKSLDKNEKALETELKPKSSKICKGTDRDASSEVRDCAPVKEEKQKEISQQQEATKSATTSKAKEDKKNDTKPLQIEEEKPIEFKRMTAPPSIAPVSLSKVSNKGVKNDKTAAIKMETKPKTNDKKFKLETGSSVESTESVISAKGVTDKVGKSLKAKTLPTEIEEDPAKDLSETKIQKKKTKAESKKKASETSLAVELSNVSVLADSLLDLLPDTSDEQINSLPVDVEKLKKATGDDEMVIDQSKSFMPADKKESTKSEIDIKKETSPIVPAALSQTDMKKILKKSKLEKVSTTPEEPSVVCKISENMDTVITVEEKSPDEPGSSDSSKNLIEISPTEPKTKSKKKSKVEKIGEAVKCDKPFSQPESTQLIETALPEIKELPLPPTCDDLPHLEKKGKKDKSSKLVKMPAKPDESDKQDIPSEMTGSKITIEPIEVGTFLSDLMDSQQVSKSKISPTGTPKSQESPKKEIISPLKFVDTYADGFATPELPAKKGKKKSAAVKVSDKSENGQSKSSYDGIQFFDKFLPETSTGVTAPWKPVSKTEDKPIPADMDYPTLGKPVKTKKTESPPTEKMEKTQSFTVDMQDEKKPKKVLKILDDLTIHEPLEEIPIDFLPPLPPLEPLEGTDENISLINFESPLQEISKPIEAEKSSPQFPKGFPADNIIFALCGSLHYENENSGKPVDSPLTLSFSDSTAHTTAEYKSLTENDDQYLSLEQSSQENAPSTSSSTCEDVTEAAYSSGGGDKITVVSEKIKNKQRRKKQLITAAPDDDEELRPLISITDNSLTRSLTTGKDKATSGKATVITETLPPLDNNQVNSDSSSSDQATTSEDPDDQICLNVQNTVGGHDDDTAAVTVKHADKSAEDDADLSASVSPPQQSSSLSSSQAQQQQQQPNSSKKKLKRRKR